MISSSTDWSTLRKVCYLCYSHNLVFFNLIQQGLQIPPWFWIILQCINRVKTLIMTLLENVYIGYTHRLNCNICANSGHKRVRLYIESHCDNYEAAENKNNHMMKTNISSNFYIYISILYTYIYSIRGLHVRWFYF